MEPSLSPDVLADPGQEAVAVFEEEKGEHQHENERDDDIRCHPNAGDHTGGNVGRLAGQEIAAELSASSICVVSIPLSPFSIQFSTWSTPRCACV